MRMEKEMNGRPISSERFNCFNGALKQNIIPASQEPYFSTIPLNP